MFSRASLSAGVRKGPAFMDENRCQLSLTQSLSPRVHRNQHRF